MNVQQLSRYRDWIAGKGALQDEEHTVVLLTQDVEAGADDAEILGTGKHAEAARYFLFDLRHAHGALASVVGERHGRVTDEAQDCDGVKGEAAQQLGRDRVLADATLARSLGGSGCNASSSRPRKKIDSPKDNSSCIDTLPVDFKDQTRNQFFLLKYLL
ncbi:hypothetical protein [Massilia sp. DWR3-1-1]|uniref:hypothetical protein n=1 Tax=Massilia sp. DWR3-1-1 TaxID=2804559 RepID=UPI003CF6A315